MVRVLEDEIPGQLELVSYDREEGLVQIAGEFRVEFRDAEVGLRENHLGIRRQRAHEIPFHEHPAESRVLELFRCPGETRAEAEPAGQYEARLRPGEYPRYSPQSVDTALLAACRGPGTDAHALDDVYRRGEPEVVVELGCVIDEFPVGLAAFIGDHIHHRVPFRIIITAMPGHGGGESE